jgi:hypothetical protein
MIRLPAHMVPSVLNSGKFVARKKRSPIKRPSPIMGGLLSRNGQLDCPVVASSTDKTILSHRLDHRPVLPEKCPGVVNVGRLHSDAASLSSALVRYLKMKRVGYRLRDFASRSAFAAHLVSPFVRRLRHFKFAIWHLYAALVARFVRHWRRIRASSWTTKRMHSSPPLKTLPSCK